MTPAEVLKNEHRVIETVLACLEKVAATCESARTLDRPVAEDIIEFLRNFADGCHHGKEEKVLFPFMESKGFPREGGPTGVMLHEHDQGRWHIREMASAIEKAAQGDRECMERFHRNATAYCQLLRMHINKEDNVLFPMAEHVQTPAETEAMLRAFDRIESDDMGSGAHERYLKLAEDLADSLGISRAEIESARASGG